MLTVLSEKAAKKVTIAHKVRAQRAKWLNMAVEAASKIVKVSVSNRALNSVYLICSDITARYIAYTRECFDISHSSGKLTVASCVVFDDNGPVKSDFVVSILKESQPVMITQPCSKH